MTCIYTLNPVALTDQPLMVEYRELPHDPLPQVAAVLPLILRRPGNFVTLGALSKAGSLSMKLSDFHFTLPDELIAHYPPESRTGSRLLALGRLDGGIRHLCFTDFPSLVRPGDLLVFNDTRVIAARLFGRKETGGSVEVLLERVLPGNEVLAQVRANHAPQAGSRLLFDTPEGELAARVAGREGEFYRLCFPADREVLEVLDRIGHMPLPPYIKRRDEALDRERYQTVYGEKRGAVAAPTAGLHFDQPMLAALRAQGVETAFVTLHVGAGTFQPVRSETIEGHRMHKEYLEVDEGVCEAVRRCRARGGRVVAVGTTSVRCLETASRGGEIAPYRGDTDIFIYPGYAFKSVDALLTNFHLPESTLIMLVCAFVGYENTMHAYRVAVEERYRFFSYGDAMFIS